MKLKYLEIFKVCVTGLLILNYVNILTKTKVNQVCLVLIANFEMLRPLTQQYEEVAIRGVL